MSKIIKLILALTTIPLLVFGAWFASTYYINNPENIRNPEFAHHHFRLQIVDNGADINFADKEFQEEYVAGQCSKLITNTPIHFHDNQNQVVHIHWAGITGGQVLKYYGLNLIGGNDNNLGRTKEGSLFTPKIVSTFTDVLPDTTEDNIWLYSGNETSYERREAKEFLNQDLETFFGKTSSWTKLQENKTSWINNLFETSVYAHEDHEAVDSEHASQEELAEINDLIGNVVVFIQDTEPTEEQIKQRFDNLEPLLDSTCGG